MQQHLVSIKSSSRIDAGLLLTGVPIAAGLLQSSDGLSLTHGELELPLWWKPTAYWPDGSIKWVFIHARVPNGEHELKLRNGNITGAAGGCKQITEGHYSSGGVELEFQSGNWKFTTPTGSWELVADVTDSDLEAPQGGFVVELAEDSPIAPLIRMRQKERNVLIKDQFLRLDPPAHRMIWQRRLTWDRGGRFKLHESVATLKSNARDMAGSGSLSVLSPGKAVRNGEIESDEFPESRIDWDNGSLWLEKGWQRYPFSMAWSGNVVSVSFYPGQSPSLGVTGGTSFRHTMHLACGRDASLTAGHITEAIIDPHYICSTGALGPLRAALTDEELLIGESIFPGYELSFKQALRQGRLTRLDTPEHGAGQAAELGEEALQDSDYFGLQHYGDWPMPWGAYGSKYRRMYASNEYDPSYAYYQGYAIYGSWTFRQIAKHSAIHMTDVDWISMDGDMRYHGYSEQAEDHQYARSAHGDYGHYWTDGYWLLYFFEGDLWARESALGVSRYLMNRFRDGGTDFMRMIWSVAERELGWPMVALMASYEAERDPEILDCVAAIVRFIDSYTSGPDREIEEEKGTVRYPVVWWRTAMQDGCKPFMLGVIMEGLERYHRATGDASAAAALVRLASFIADRMWVPGRASFIYEWNAYGRKHRNIHPQDLTPLFVRGLGYAFELTGDRRFRDISEKAFHACLWTLHHPETGGKSIAIIGRTLGAFAAMAEDWLHQDEAAKLQCIQASVGAPFQWDEGITKLLSNGSICITDGQPELRGRTLICNDQSYVTGRFKQPVFSDCGEIEFRTMLNKTQEGGLNQRCYIHLSDEAHTQSCISIITFYQNLHVRVYDSNRELIDVAEALIDPDSGTVWRYEGEPNTVLVLWQAPGELVLFINGTMMERRLLNRRIGGAFRRIHLGHKPGNWRLNGSLEITRIGMAEKQQR